MSVYDNFVQQLSTRKKDEARLKPAKKETSLKKEIDQELKKDIQGDVPVETPETDGAKE
jgi:pyruvate formate-lyase activating enzyme-like uncharacterized protein